MQGPRVSIGMPVRNGQKFIRQALDSLLAQTYTDFEINITDNASTDQTEAICREYMQRDARVHYFRNAKNLGPAENYNECFRKSSGEYFRWHAHDDMCAPEYLARCVQVLDSDPSVVIAYPSTITVDEEGRTLEEYSFRPGADLPRASERFRQLVLVNHRKHRAVEIFGLMRAAALRSIPPQGAYARSDSVILARMALRGRFLELPDRLFLSRSHASQSMQTLPSVQKTGRSKMSRWLGSGPLPPPEWWDESRRGKMNFPEWNLFKEYWVSVGPASLSGSERLRCYGTMMKWLMLNPHKLARDVIFSSETLILRAMNWIGGTAQNKPKASSN